jgi:hypothetical protein
MNCSDFEALKAELKAEIVNELRGQQPIRFVNPSVHLRDHIVGELKIESWTPQKYALYSSILTLVRWSVGINRISDLKSENLQKAKDKATQFIKVLKEAPQ